MNYRRLLALALAAVCLLPAQSAAGAEVESGEIYCFGSGDFSREDLAGICVTALPEPEMGSVMLGDRVIRPGDVLSAGQLEGLTFQPRRRETDAQAQVCYLPILDNRVAPESTMTISIRGRENQAPIAEDFAAETYKNLPIEGKLKVKDPEGEAMTFTMVRQPKRGSVELRSDGSFVYTPKKNKVGIDSFVFTATDETGKVSREATVTVTIVKPTDSTQYTDTLGHSCRFAAEWMKNTGIFVGETLDGNACFSPEKEVTRGQFLAMAVRALDIPMEPVSAGQFEDQPQWLRPYLAAAMRSGLLSGLQEGDPFTPVSGAEAAVILQNALALPAQTLAEESSAEHPAQAVLQQHGITLESPILTRGEAALALYRASRLAPEAPGMTVIRKQH